MSAPSASETRWQRVVATGRPARLPAAWAGGGVGRRRVAVPVADLRTELCRRAAVLGVHPTCLVGAAHHLVLATVGAIDDGAAAYSGLGPGTDPVGRGRVVVLLAHPDTPRRVEELVRRMEDAIRSSRGSTCPGSSPDGPTPIVFDPHRGLDALDGVDLRVAVTDGAVELDADVGAVSGSMLEVLGALYRNAVESVATRGALRPGTLLPEGMRNEELRAGESPSAAPTTTSSWPLAVAEQARLRPDAIAVISGRRRTTFRELDEQANRIAQRLRRLGVRPGSLVALLLRRDGNLLPAMLGVARCGAAYVPLDPALPLERLAFILDDTRCAAMVTVGARPALDLDARLLVLDDADDARGVAAEPGLAPPVELDPELPAYVLYTSGSTGTPKGVVVTHRALAALLAAFSDRRGRWLASTSVGFDISALELLAPLVTGGAVVLAGEGAGPSDLLELVAEHRVDHLQATPSHWRLLLAAGADLPTVRALVGGEELPPELATRLRPRVADLVNVYGPTETTIWSAAWPVSGSGTVSLGAPLPSETVRVLDDGADPVARGVTGEICIGGTGLAHGYLNRPGLTAGRFVPDPHGPPGARLYRTGDLARRETDGSLTYLGRSDTQVKLGGHRIELGEIEAVLREHPAVRDAVTTVRDAPGGGRLVAYVVADGRVDAASLRALLSGRLPAYMVPSGFVAIERVPLSPSGKVDRRALPADRPPRRPRPPDRTGRTSPTHPDPSTSPHRPVKEPQS